MAPPVWQQKLRAALEANPLCFVKGTVTVKHIKCLDPSEKKGKTVSLREVVNYNCFNTCAKCKVTVR